MTTTEKQIHYTNMAFHSDRPRPLGDYAATERDLLSLCDLILTAMVRIEIHASRPETNERLFAFFDRITNIKDEPWREHLLTLIKSFRDEEGSND